MNAAEIVPLPRKTPHPGVLRRLIADLASRWLIKFTFHAEEERSGLRSIGIDEARRVLMIGEIEGPIEPGVGPGEWRCKVVARAEGSSRRIGVATVVIRTERLLLPTVEWEDK